MNLCVLSLLLVQYVLYTVAQIELNSEKIPVDIVMRGVRTTKNDEYKCTSYEMPDTDSYIVQYKPMADAGTAHHILMFGCEEPFVSDPEATWNCGQVCRGRQDKILYAWAKNAPDLSLPKDVGFRVGGSSSIKHIVIQVHYAMKTPDNAESDRSGIRLYMTKKKQKYEAGIFLLLAYTAVIPANKPKVHADISCTYYGSGNMYPFAYRTHAHGLGRVITGYKVDKKGNFTMIGKGNPQWPQAFWSINKQIVIKPGEQLVGRCTFNSTGRDSATFMGANSDDEMCNFYIMYYKDPATKIHHKQCVDNRIPSLFNKIPPGSDTPLPYNATLEAAALGHHHSRMSGSGTGVDEEIPTKFNNVQSTQPDKEESHHYVAFQSDFSNGNTMQDGGTGLTGQEFPIGQVGGVASDTDGNVYVFHRGDRKWEYNTFDLSNSLRDKSKPIGVDTIIVYSKDSKIVRKFGKDLFYMPHGISVDSDNNVWVTDVGLHQVMKFPAGSDQPDPNSVIGVKFVPGSDKYHFCKPTDVVVLKSGEIFVSDGYCNSRIMKFDKNGNLLKIFGTSVANFGASSDGYPAPGQFDIPHSLALAEDKKLVCVADRENGRIQCFDYEGNFVRQIHHKEFGTRLFAIEYCPLHGGLLFAVNGPPLDSSSITVQGFIVDINKGTLVETWNTQKGLRNPHDVTVDTVHLRVYVGELDPSKVWRFDMMGESGSLQTTTKATITKAPIVTVRPTSGEVSSTLSPKNSKGPQGEEDEEVAVVPAIIIGALLIIPVIIIIIVVVFVRVYKKGQYNCCRRYRSHSRKKFNLGDILSPHRGFDRLSTEESENEIDLSDSDQEEYSITQKA